jgi:hypothetical protein
MLWSCRRQRNDDTDWSCQHWNYSHGWQPKFLSTSGQFPVDSEATPERVGGQRSLDPQLVLYGLPDALSLDGLLKYRLSDNGFPFSLTLFLSRDPISSLIEFGYSTVSGLWVANREGQGQKMAPGIGQYATLFWSDILCVHGIAIKRAMCRTPRQTIAYSLNPERILERNLPSLLVSRFLSADVDTIFVL